MSVKASELKVGYVLDVDSCDVKQYEGEHIVGEVQVLEAPGPRSKYVLVESPDLMAKILVPLKDCELIQNHSVNCKECNNWEEMGADESRGNFNSFTLLKEFDDGTGLYSCNNCKREMKSEIHNKEDL